MCLRTMESKKAIQDASKEKLKEGEKIYKDAELDKKRNDRLSKNSFLIAIDTFETQLPRMIITEITAFELSSNPVLHS